MCCFAELATSSKGATDPGDRLKLNSGRASRAIAIDASVQSCISWSSETGRISGAREHFSTEIATLISPQLMLPRALGREIHAENQNFEKSRDKFMKTVKMNADWVKTRAQQSRVCTGQTTPFDPPGTNTAPVGVETF